MRLGHWTNGISCEYHMQDKLAEWLSQKEIPFIREFYLASVRRRPDFLILKNPQVLINVEAKCNNHSEMMIQLKDNSVVCKYSFAFIPDYCMTSIDFKMRLLKSGYGLIVYNYSNDVVTEVLESHVNIIENKELYKNTIKIVTSAIKKQNAIELQKRKSILFDEQPIVRNDKN